MPLCILSVYFSDHAIFISAVMRIIFTRLLIDLAAIIPQLYLCGNISLYRIAFIIIEGNARIGRCKEHIIAPAVHSGKADSLAFTSREAEAHALSGQY